MTDDSPLPDDDSPRQSDGHSPRTRIVRGLLDRLGLQPFDLLYQTRTLEALFTFFTGTLTIGLLAIVAVVADAAFVFPSLGPTAYLLFYRPLASSSSPKNTVLGHLVGAVCGWGSLAAFGLLGAPDALTAGVTWAHVGSAAVSLGLTGGLMALFKISHPPAGATTLIVSLGLMPHLWQLPVLMLAVVLMTLLGFAINRMAGLDVPVWSPVEKG